MNHCVPDFEIQMDGQDYPLPPPNPNSSAFHRQKKPFSMQQEDDVLELLWQNGQVVAQSQNHRPLRKSGDDIPAGTSTLREIRPEEESYRQHLIMQEDEMASWLHYPIDDLDPPSDRSFCADLLYTPPPILNYNGNSSMQTPAHARPPQMTMDLPQPPRAIAPRPPIPPTRRPDQAPTAKTPNFACFARHNARSEAPGPSSSSKAAAREPTVVDSCDTPFPAAVTSRVSETVRFSTEQTEGDADRRSMSMSGAGVAGGGRGSMTCDLTMTSSPSNSSSSDEPVQRVAAEDRKRKGREVEQWDCQSEDVGFESAEAKKQVRESTSTKRSRAAEVHNLSERRRRDRINEKMKALQELIPRCNKSDKASMLDEAIEYLKSLQLQVQMMSMGCGMVPMMFPGIQQYMPAMGMRMGMGMGMGMEMGMNRPVMPFPNMLAGSALPATAAAHLGPRFPMPPFHMPHVPAPDASRMQAANQPADNSMLTTDPNQSRIPNFTDPYQQYLGPHQMQFQLMQNQAMNQPPNISRPITSRGPENPENHRPGEK